MSSDDERDERDERKKRRALDDSEEEEESGSEEDKEAADDHLLAVRRHIEKEYKRRIGEVTKGKRRKEVRGFKTKMTKSSKKLKKAKAKLSRRLPDAEPAPASAHIIRGVILKLASPKVGALDGPGDAGLRNDNSRSGRDIEPAPH
eukprot:3701387-Prymnesium_polylepis.1